MIPIMKGNIYVLPATLAINIKISFSFKSNKFKTVIDFATTKRNRSRGIIDFLESFKNNNNVKTK